MQINPEMEDERWRSVVRPLVRCIHPQVTLIEKLDAMMRRWGREDLPTSAFVRHYEDAARVIAALTGLPPMAGTAKELMVEMLDAHQIRALPDTEHPAFTLPAGARTEELREAHTAIGAMFWGRRISLEEACATIRGWIEVNLPTDREPKELADKHLSTNAPL